MATIAQANGPFEEVPLDNSDARSVSSESSYDLLSDDESPNSPAAATESAAPAGDVASQPDDSQVETSDFQDVEVDAKRAQLRSRLVTTFQELISMINYADDSNPSDADKHTNLFRMKANEISALFGDDVDKLKHEIDSLTGGMSKMKSLLLNSAEKQGEYLADIHRLTESEKLLKERLHEAKVDLSLAEGEKVASKMEARQRYLDLETLSKKLNETVQAKEEHARDYRIRYQRFDDWASTKIQEIKLLCTQVNTLQAEKAESENRDKHLRMENAQLNTRIDEMHRKLKGEEDQNRIWAEAVEVSKVRINELQQAEEEVVGNNTVLQGKVEILTKQLELAQAREKTLTADKRDLKACVSRLQDEKRASAKAYNHYESRIKEFKATTERLDFDLKNSQQKLEKNETQVDARVEAMRQVVKYVQQRRVLAEGRAKEAEQKATEAEQKATEAEQAHAEAKKTSDAKHKLRRDFCRRVMRDLDDGLRHATKEASVAKEQAMAAEEKLKRFREFQKAVAERKVKAAAKDDGETKKKTVYEAWWMTQVFPDSLKTFDYRELFHFISSYKDTSQFAFSETRTASEEKFQKSDFGGAVTAEELRDRAKEWNEESEARLKICQALHPKFHAYQKERWELEKAAEADPSQAAQARGKAARVSETDLLRRINFNAYRAGVARELAWYAENHALKLESLAKGGSKDDLFASGFLKAAQPEAEKVYTTEPQPTQTQPEADKVHTAEPQTTQSKKEVSRECVRNMYRTLYRVKGKEFADKLLVKNWPDYQDLKDEDFSA